ncbi:hypothetical protein BKA62DRAFT_710898 [Auriculariales sp. MPI-PUGE-AT-0066]|nr:hypothetical protein BKA62DRAFT_710898 [Auriculariales sp. MPI-PUGE-AT-0066]
MSTAPPPPSQSVLSENLGPLLVASWLNTTLFMLEVIQLAGYMKRFWTDAIWVRAMVLVMFSLDLVGSCSVCAIAYEYLVLCWGDEAVMMEESITFAVYHTTMIIVVVLTHGFLIRRVFLLSANVIAAVVLGLLALTSFVSGSLVAHNLTRDSTLPYSHLQYLSAAIWNASSATSNILISLAMVLQLYLREPTLPETGGPVRRVARVAILSGVGMAILALGSLVLYVVKPDITLSLVCSFCIGRASTITVLYNLNDLQRAQRKPPKPRECTSIPFRTMPPAAGQSQTSSSASRATRSDHARTVSLALHSPASIELEAQKMASIEERVEPSESPRRWTYTEAHKAQKPPGLV